MQPYEELEQKWSEFNGLDPAWMVACSSGTAAIHLALEALQMPPGSEVVTSDFNMIAVPRAITLAGLVPVFVDCDERLLMDTSRLGLACVGKASRGGQDFTASAIIQVAIYGRVCENDRQYVGDIAAKNGLRVIEDLAEAHGVRPHPSTDAACWSFYKNKIVAGEEGGAVWFRDKAHADLARQLRCLGFTDAHDFTHVPRGHNYRMSNLHADAILKSLRWAAADPSQGTGESSITVRRRIEAWYDAACPDAWRQPPRDAPWVYDLRIRGMGVAAQNNVIAALQRNGIAARHAFKPMSRQAEYSGCRRVVNAEVMSWSRSQRKAQAGLGLVSAADIAAAEVIYLPIQPGVTTREKCAQAFDIIRSVVQQ